MNIVMFTNTYIPHVGGVARSVSELASSLRAVGEKVMIVAPEFDEFTDLESEVFRTPAIKSFAGSGFSVPLPLPTGLHEAVSDFNPDIVHSHHPFLLGGTALRIAAEIAVPVVYTYHTRYELYGHYVSQDMTALKRLMLSLSLGYCDLCDQVIAPSQSIARMLEENLVQTPVTIIPTGVNSILFTSGRGRRARDRFGIPQHAILVGHVGRLAPEKNLDYLMNALSQFMHSRVESYLIVTGDGSMRESMQDFFSKSGLSSRVRFTGTKTGEDLADIYDAMDLFAFSSVSETQGLVLVEAMMSGTPVVAIDAVGVREVVEDTINGRLLPADASTSEFAIALAETAQLNRKTFASLKLEASKTAKAFSAETMLGKVLALYESVCTARVVTKRGEDDGLRHIRRRIAREIDIMGNAANAISDALLPVSDRNDTTD